MRQIDDRAEQRALYHRVESRELTEPPIDKHLDRLTFILDRAIRVPGTDIRFGLDPVIGFLFPAAGDAISSLMSIYIIAMSIRYGLPKIVTARMVFNVGVDFLIGSVPLLGDLFDFAWKANSKNIDLLNKHATRGGRSSWSDWLWFFVLVGAFGFMALGLLAFVIYAFKATGTALF